jgi:3-(3-hydroxy-phenyl)propionate hydroxylase
MPDLDLHTLDGPTRIYSLLHGARPVLVNFGASAPGVIAAWEDRVRHVEAQGGSSWELPVLGQVQAPAAVLIRPDGHVAWAGEVTDERLPVALTTWFGPPSMAGMPDGSDDNHGIPCDDVPARDSHASQRHTRRVRDQE